MRNAIRIGRLFGVDLRVDSSWLLIFVLVMWSLSSLFATWHPDWFPLTSFVVALVAALAFFASVLFHELAHTLVARAYGITVRDITLHMFGGVSNIEREPPTPGAEFLIAIVGPLSSVALGVAMLIVGALLTGLSGTTAEVDTATEAISRMGPLATLLFWLGPVNVAVGIFNLVPGFPLDGGRVLRAILWKVSGNMRAATYWATSVGQFVGWAFIGLGVAMAFGYRIPFFGRGLAAGLWLALIGLFLRNAAAQHYAGAAVEDALRGLRVRDLMRVQGAWIDANVPVRTIVDEWFLRHEDRALPVFDGSDFVGLVCLEDVRRVAPQEWISRTARDVMTPASALAVVKPEDDVLGALRIFGEKGVRQLPVVEDGTLLGLLLEQDIARWIELQSAPPGSLRPVRPRPA